MTHRGFSEGGRGSLILVAWLILGGCSGSSKVPATPKCYLASDCKNPLQCVQGYCVAACVQSRDCPSGERCIGATEGNTCQPLETATCQYTSQCTTPLVCAFDQKCREGCLADIDCPTGQKCTSITHLCADPTIDKNYDLATNEFVAKNDGGVASGGAGGTGGTGGGTGGVGGAVTGTGGAGAGGGSGGNDAGVDAAVANPGDSGAGGGSSGGGDVGVDAPVTNPGDDSGTASGGAGGSAGGAGGSSKRDAGKAGSTGTACQAGQAPSNFGNAATSDSDPNYKSGVGLLTATEFLTFNGYFGPDSSDAGAGATVCRIDVQHFNPITGKSKGEAAPLLTVAGVDKIYITGADIAPTGEIAIIYSAHNIATGGWGDTLAFFDKTLALSRTTPFVAWGSDYYADSSFVKWLNGEFVASSTWYNGYMYMKVGYFAATGANAGGTNVVPTDNPSSYVYVGDMAEGEVAFSGGTFAVEYLSTADTPYLTLLDTQGDEVGPPVNFSPAFAGATGGDYFVSVAGTSQGFVAVYNGTSSASAASLLATFVSNSASGDAGVPVGATYAFPGGRAYAGPWSVRGSSDGTGAGFAVHYPNGSVSFLYFGADGSPRGTPQTVLYQQEPTGTDDEVLVTNFGGTFAVSLFSGVEHSTQVIASTTCQ
jgi:hypothetical protein